MEKLINIQTELKVPKGNFNSFGKYKYRSSEDILEAVKPLLLKHNCTLILTDEIVLIGNKIFMKSTAKFADLSGTKSTVSTNGFAETSEHKGMSAEQTTGTASSYARKYALNGLFLIDETESDADSQKPKEEVKKVKETPIEKPYLNENSDAFTKAVKFLVDGGTIEEIEKKYSLSQSVKDLLSTKTMEAIQ